MENMNEIFGLFEEEFGEVAGLTKLCSDLTGKKICIIGGNGTGKSTQIANLKNYGYTPIFLPLEAGLNAISGVITLASNSYSDLKKNVKKLTSKKFMDKIMPNKPIIVYDGIENLTRLAETYVCSSLGIEKIKDYNNGYGAWKELSEAIRDITIPIINSSYTVCFIGHPKEVKKDRKGKEVFLDIDGDNRLTKVLKDNCDFILYVENNGIDEDGNELLSTAYSKETEDFFARSRFTHFPFSMEFTAENLLKNLEEAVKLQSDSEEEFTTYEDQQKVYGEHNEDTFEDILDSVKQMLGNIEPDSKLEEQAFDLLDKTFGSEVNLSDLTFKNKEALLVFRDEIEELLNR